jgi:hypothetical protein
MTRQDSYTVTEEDRRREDMKGDIGEEIYIHGEKGKENVRKTGRRRKKITNLQLGDLQDDQELDGERERLV